MATAPSLIACRYIEAAQSLLEAGLRLIESGTAVTSEMRPKDCELPYYRAPIDATVRRTALRESRSIYGASLPHGRAGASYNPVFRFEPKERITGAPDGHGRRLYPVGNHPRMDETLAAFPFDEVYGVTLALDGEHVVAETHGSEARWEDVDREVGAYFARANAQIYAGERLLSAVWDGICDAADASENYLLALTAQQEADAAWEAVREAAGGYMRVWLQRSVEAAICCEEPRRATELGAEGLAALDRAVGSTDVEGLFERYAPKEKVASANHEGRNATGVVVTGVAIAMGHLRETLEEFGFAPDTSMRSMFEEIEHEGERRWVHRGVCAHGGMRATTVNNVLTTSPEWRGLRDGSDISVLRDKASAFGSAALTAEKARERLSESEQKIAELKASVAWLVARASFGETVDA